MEESPHGIDVVFQLVIAMQMGDVKSMKGMNPNESSLTMEIKAYKNIKQNNKIKLNTTHNTHKTDIIQA